MGVTTLEDERANNGGMMKGVTWLLTYLARRGREVHLLTWQELGRESNRVAAVGHLHICAAGGGGWDIRGTRRRGQGGGWGRCWDKGIGEQGGSLPTWHGIRGTCTSSSQRAHLKTVPSFVLPSSAV